MIKAKAGDLYIIGISEENVKRLKKDMPIKINLAEMGLEGEMLIFYKPTTGDLIQFMQKFTNEETVIHDNLD